MAGLTNLRARGDLRLTGVHSRAIRVPVRRRRLMCRGVRTRKAVPERYGVQGQAHTQPAVREAESGVELAISAVIIAYAPLEAPTGPQQACGRPCLELLP